MSGDDTDAPQGWRAILNPDSADAHALGAMASAQQAAKAAPRGPHAALTDEVMSRIRGQQDAQRVLHTIRQGCATEDALLDAIHAVQGTGDAERTRALVREVQKHIECSRSA